MATARTCYSPNGLVLPEDVSLKPDLRDRIATTIYQAGHHTTLQHAHVQFGLENVSRHFIWSFLHAHPFYNSEQVSQRYVRVEPRQMAVPPLTGAALTVYRQTMQRQIDAYQALIDLLTPTVTHFYFQTFPQRAPAARRDSQAHPLARRWIPKKSMEVARYVLPVATFAYLYHTVSVLTLLRYYRLCRQFDTPHETRIVVQGMVDALLALDPQLNKILEEPLPLEQTLEYQFWQSASWPATASAPAFRQEFDAELGDHVSKLVSWKQDNETLLAQSVREVLGLPRAALNDAAAIALVLDPRQNPYFGESLNVTTLSKLTRTLHHPGYTFRKKLSHTADSQDQRHRTTPASRPLLSAYLGDDPDFITPALLWHNDTARALYDETMARTWEGIHALRRLGVPDEYAAYLLPNGVAIRFSESADLLALHHKLRLRLCYNAQEEIFAASQDEALQIAAINPTIGQYLGAPCTLRHAATARPICPEGDRYCGVPVWRLAVADYDRVL
ncbi:MAG: FAD-dependent thymidylate synthase [Anaerolineales bacterium]|nr:FAD-dependent thymidylate synthase [Anaerolineales bacterium]MCB8954463.1 FAD-dependent thymidylate synthase [Ardenticatenales bacterium]